MHTDDLKMYPIPQALAVTLAKADAVAQSIARCGRPVPEKIALYELDFDRIDRVVKSLTGGKLTAEQTHWNGRYLKRLPLAA
jgi:(2Fe-2S) ferredoxin